MTATTGGGTFGSPRRAAALLGPLLLAALVGLAMGRFLFLDGASSAAGPAPVRTLSLEERVAGLEQTVEANPTDLPAWQALGVGYTDRAIATGDPAFYDLATRALDRAEGLDPGHPDTLLGRGKLQLSLHQFSDALATGEAAVAARPDNAASLGVLVDAQVELGQYDAATGTLQRMLDRSPDLQALSRASYLRELHGDLDGAVTAMRQAEAAGSAAALDRATVAALLGDLYLRRGDLPAARAAYDRALAEEPALPAATAGLARLAHAEGDTPAAVDLVAEAVQRQPVPGLVVLHADLLRLEGRDAEAADADEVARAVTALQGSAGQIVDLESARFEADRAVDPEAAIALARTAHDTRPDNVFTNDALAWALHRAGRSAEALPYAEQAIRLGTADPGLRARAALVLEAAGQPDRARAELEAAFGMAPWTALTERAPAAALAERLGVAVPPAWGAA